MNEILKFKNFNKLKHIYRSNHVKKRNESAAEHSWSSLILADYFLEKFKYSINKVRVYELLMYHDIVEIESGDIVLSPDNEINFNKKEKEFAAAENLKDELPITLQDKFLILFKEFEEQKTIEARFAKAVDSFDPIIQEVDYKQYWKGWSKEFLVSKKKIYFQEFPEIFAEFNKVLEFLEKEGYFVR